jgi:hypothetical protein
MLFTFVVYALVLTLVWLLSPKYLDSCCHNYYDQKQLSSFLRKSLFSEMQILFRLHLSEFCTIAMFMIVDLPTRYVYSYFMHNL